MYPSQTLMTVCCIFFLQLYRPALISSPTMVCIYWHSTIQCITQFTAYVRQPHTKYFVIPVENDNLMLVQVNARPWCKDTIKLKPCGREVIYANSASEGFILIQHGWLVKISVFGESPFNQREKP